MQTDDSDMFSIPYLVIIFRNFIQQDIMVALRAAHYHGAKRLSSNPYCIQGEKENI